ncbi:MAG: phosphoribosyltransferase family protein [Bacillota bacterium]|nr:phosphoribosyltransferase family protein [Bacillota bacterium]
MSTTSGDAIRKVHLSWESVAEAVDRLVRKLPSDYDALLVVTRGGMVPACLISEKTGMRNILVAAVMFYDDVDRRIEQPTFLQFPPDPFLKGRRILVVDDVWDTGRTVMAVKERVLAAGGRPEVAVLHYKPSRSLFPDEAPDYYDQVIEEWIVYPWEPDGA